MSRLLVIMGSGETSPTMAGTHRDVFGRVGTGPSVLLDTTYGFQENADDISARAVEYFRTSVGRDVEVVQLRGAPDESLLESERMLARLRQAVWVFAGPGSPSYALSVWRPSIVPGLLADKLHEHGAVVFASAAALTLGRLSVPVYEVYKVGAAPFWLPGLDLLAETAGLDAVVIPHYNNAEGGGHDTRYCYLGERRLRVMEEELPETTVIIGVDEHTACCIDLDTRSATVSGLGCVTARRRGRSVTFEAGSVIPLSDLASEAASGSAVTATAFAPREGAAPTRSPLSSEVARLENAFGDAVGAGKSADAVGAVLELDQLLVDWSRDTLESDDLDRARSALRTLVVRLGEAAQEGLRDPRQVIGPFVDTLLDLRDRLRQDRRFDLADEIRDRLVVLGIGVHDTRDGTQWDRSG